MILSGHAPSRSAAHDALKREQESHRKTKEEFAKARTALTFVRTQALVSPSCIFVFLIRKSKGVY